MLLVEERSRQIRFLERVVENGRKLQASEQYIHDPKRDLADFFQYTTLARSSDSPSEIEKVYTAARGDIQSRKRKHRKSRDLEGQKANNGTAATHRGLDVGEWVEEAVRPKIPNFLVSNIEGVTSELLIRSKRGHNKTLSDQEGLVVPNDRNASRLKQFQAVSDQQQDRFRSFINTSRHRDSRIISKSINGLTGYTGCLRRGVAKRRYSALLQSFRGCSTFQRISQLGNDPSVNDAQSLLTSISTYVSLSKPGRALQLFHDYHKLIVSNIAKPYLDLPVNYVPRNSEFVSDQLLTYLSCDISSHGYRDVKELQENIGILANELPRDLLSTFQTLFPKEEFSGVQSGGCIARSLLVSICMNVASTGQFCESILGILSWLRQNDELRVLDIETICGLLLDHYEIGTAPIATVSDILQSFTTIFPPKVYSKAFLRRVFTIPEFANRFPNYAKHATSAKTDDPPSLSYIDEIRTQVHQHLREGRIRKAGTLLERVKPQSYGSRMPGKWLELVHQISNAALQLRATDIVKRMEKLSRWDGHPDPICYTNLMGVLLSNTADQDLFKVVELYRQQGHQVSLPGSFYPRICTAFLKSSNFNEAIHEVCKITRLPMTPAELERCHICLTHILRRLWNESRAFNAVHNSYKTIENEIDGPMPYLLQNTMLVISLEAGLPERARDYLMVEGKSNRYRDDTITLGHVMLGHALKDDWEQVEYTLGLIGNSDVQNVDVQSSTDLFNAVLRRYTRNHTSTEVEQFVCRAITQHKVTIDTFSKDIILECYVRDRCLDRYPWLVRSLQELGFKFQHTSATAYTLIRKFFQTNLPESKIMLHIGRTFLESRREILSRNFFGVVRESLLYDRRKRGRQMWLKAFPTQLKEVETYMDTLPPVKRVYSKALGSQKPSYGSLETEMFRAISLDRPLDAIELFKRALMAGARWSTVSTVLVTSAIVKANHGDLTESNEILEQAKEIGLNTTKAFAAQMIGKIRRNEQLNCKKLFDFVFNFYKRLWSEDFDPDYHLAVTAGSYFNRQGEPIKCITLLRGLHDLDPQSRGSSAEQMTVLLDAYGHNFRPSIEGVQWVVDTVLEEDLIIGYDFMRQLRVAVRNCVLYAQHKSIPQDELESLRDLCKSLKMACADQWWRQRVRTYEEAMLLVRTLGEETSWDGHTAHERKPMLPVEELLTMPGALI